MLKSETKRNVILYLTHSYTYETELNFIRILKQKPESYDLVMCIPFGTRYGGYYRYSLTDGFLRDNKIRIYEYDNDKVNRGMDEELGFSWVNPCRVLESFFVENRYYDYYYVVEFDIYTPDWGLVFNSIDNHTISNSDLIASNVYNLHRECEWPYYKKYLKYHPEDERQCLSALLSFMRVSNRGMEAILSSLCDAITDEIAELYYPTIIYNSRMIIKSLQKDGYYGGLELVEKDKFDVNVHFRNPEIMYEKGKLYHALKDTFGLDAIIYADDIVKQNRILSFRYTNDDEKTFMVIDKLITFGFTYFEVYRDDFNPNGFISHFTDKDIREYLLSLNESVIVKGFKEHLNPYSLLYCGNFCNILHLNAHSRRLFDIDAFNTNIVSIPNDITVITVESDESQSPLIRQLKRSNIPYINGCQDCAGLPYLTQKNLTYKADYINNALRKVETEYTLFLDSRDVILFDFNDFMDKYKSYGTDILFGSDVGRFPENLYTDIEDRFDGLDRRYINTGTILGVTKTMKHVFGIISDAHMLFGNDKTEGVYEGAPIDSGDQGFVRKFVDIFNTWYGRNVIGYDYDSKLFLSALSIPMCVLYNNMIISRKQYDNQ